MAGSRNHFGHPLELSRKHQSVGTQCPIASGRCCGDCSDLGPNGCLLSREKRPPYCTTFLCEIAEAKIADRMTQDEALAALVVAWGKGSKT